MTSASDKQRELKGIIAFNALLTESPERRIGNSENDHAQTERAPAELTAGAPQNKRLIVREG
jgi:hypothetical protein